MNRTMIEKLTGRPYQPRPNPYWAADIRDDRAFKDELLLTPPDADELERAERWRDASEVQHGTVILELMRLFGSIPNRPPKTDIFPGFPRYQKTTSR